MLLQDAGGCLLGDVALDNLLDDLGLVLAPGHEDNLLGLHDGVDAHGDGHLGDVVDRREELGLCLDGVEGELDEACLGAEEGAGLVEANLPLFTHADNHEVHLVFGFVAVSAAVLADLAEGHGAVGDVDVLGEDVDVVEELRVDAVVAALLVLGGDGVELVEAIHLHVAEADLAGHVADDQLAVEAEGRVARGEAEHEGTAGAGCLVGHDGTDNFVGYVLYTFVFAWEYLCGDFLETADDVFGNG